jgi:hypothetical protein
VSLEPTTELAAAVVTAEAPQELQEHAAQNLIQPVTLDTLVERVTLIKEAMRRCMVEGQHYGTIPGTKKPSLWKPGAELICTLFQLGTRYPNHVNQVAREQGHFVFTLTCELFHIPSGRVIGEGVGACSTSEYRYRIQTEDRHTDQGQLIKAKYTPYDFYNTALKIGKKRAMVDAVLTVTGASEIFTQDTEDDPDKYRGEEPAARTGNWHQKEARRPLPQRPSQPTKANKGSSNGKNHDTGVREDIAGMIDRAWPNDYQGKRYYFAKVNGQQLQTTDQNLGERLLAAANRVVIATVEPAPNKPGKFYVKALDVPEVPTTTASEGDATLDDDLGELP